jgi:tetratricopeptide (TPR) repeat protein
MIRRSIAIALAVALALAVPAPSSAQLDREVQEALTSLKKALAEAETPEASLTALTAFLDKYPDTPLTRAVLGGVARVLVEQIGDRDRAAKLIKAYMDKFQSEESIKGANIILASVYGTPRFKEELRAQVQLIKQYEDLDFSDLDALVRAAVGAEEWDLALELCDSAAAAATEEAVRRSYPDASEEKIREGSRRRTAEVTMYRGWARANKGEFEAALKAFESASSGIELNYFGTPNNDLYLYWGKTLFMEGRNEDALQKLLPVALWRNDDEALDAVRTLFLESGGAEEDFESYIHRKRLETAKGIAGFTAQGYDGRARSLDDMMGKVTLVAFWFPT